VSEREWNGPILDNHFHLNRKGRFLAAAKDFKNAGGSDLVLVHCPDFQSPPIDKNGHFDSYSNTVAMAEEVRSELGLGVRVILGPHPAAFAHQFESMEEQDAVENYWHSIDAALHFVNEGLAHGIGEVGRPHWKVSDEVWELSNKLLEETMSLAAKEGVPLQLHVEGESDATYPELAKMADRVGLERHRLVRHYAPGDISEQATCGLVPSVLMGKDSLPKLLNTLEDCKTGFMLETDYMDDPRRPGAVLGPKTVPKRTRALIEAGVPEEVLWNSHVDLPLRTYGPCD